MTLRIVPQHEQHFPDHLLATRLQEYVFDDGRPPTMNRHSGALAVGLRQIQDAVTTAQLEVKNTAVGLAYYLGTALHEAGCTNEWDTEIASPSCPQGYVSVGLYQLGREEARQWGFVLEDMLDLYKSTVCMVRITEERRRALRQLLHLGSSEPDPAYTDADGVVYPGGNLRAYLAVYHNQGGGAAAATIKRYGCDWAAYSARNPTANLVSHHYGYDCITGGPEYKNQANAAPYQVTFRRELKLTQPYMIGADVRQLQYAIRHHAPELALNADGEFGPMTQQALQHVQVELGLAPTGVCTQSVWTQLGVTG